MDQLISVGAEKPLGKKHINLEPHTQLGSFILEMMGWVENGGLRIIHEEVRGLHREPHLETALVVGEDDPMCHTAALLAWGWVCAQGKEHV